MAIRLFVLLAPVVSAFALCIFVARHYPAHRLGVNPWLWWIGMFCAANLYLVWVDRFLSRLLPIATLFRISLVFPDQAPNRFKAALRSTNSRSTLKRLAEAREDDSVSDEITNAETLIALVTALSDHDRMTRGHAERVQAYCDLIAEELDLSDEDRGKLRWGALLHDMGKLDVPGEILNKDGRPDEEEWAILQGHPAAGRAYVDPLRPWLGDWLGAVDQHHCRWDGNGYPYDLAGADITLSGRIAAVADAYDVMTSVRSYKKAMAPEVARQELVNGAGSQFDPEIVRAFLRVGIGQLRLVAGPLAWLASATGTAPAPIVGPALASMGAAVAVVGGSTFGALPEPVESLAYVETATMTATGLPLTVFEDESGAVEVDVVSESAEVGFAVAGGPGHGSIGLSSSFVDSDGLTVWTAIYTPAADYFGQDELAVLVCEREDQCEQVRIAITVVPVQDPPVAGDDYAELPAGAEMAVEPLSNDVDVDGDRLRVVEATAVDGGAIEIDGDRLVFKAPAEPGSYEVVYVVEDGAGGTSEAVVVFVVGDVESAPSTSTTTTPTTTPTTRVPEPDVNEPVGRQPVTPPSTTTTTTAPAPNMVPVAVDDAVTTLEDQSIRFSPLLNDSDADGDPLTVVDTSPPGSGSVSIDAATQDLIYTPAADFWGADKFTYTVADSSGARATAVVSVAVTAVNDPPVATALVSDLAENGDGSELLGSVSAFDVDDAQLTFSLVDDQVGGMLVIDGAVTGSTGSFAIDPASGELRAAASFDYEVAAVHSLTVSVSDGVASTTVPVTVSILDVDEPPVVSASSASVAENAAVGAVVAASSASDPEGTQLEYAIVSGDPLGLFTVDASGVVTVANSLDFEAGSVFELQVDVADGVHTVGELITVNVTDVNEPPVTNGSSASLAEDATIGSTVATVTASDPEGDDLTFTIAGGDPGGWFTIDGSGAVTTSAALDHELSPLVSLVIEVGDGANVVAETVTVTVTDVNEPPVLVDPLDSVSEDVAIGTKVLTMGTFDPEGAPLSYMITSGDPAKRLAVDGFGVISTAAKLDFETHGGFTLTVDVSDGVFTVTETVTVNVLDVNEPPVTAPASGTVSESAAVGTTVTSLSASDPEGGALTYAIVGGDPNGRFAIDKWGDVTTADLLDFETVDTYTLTVEVSDGVFTVTETVSVAVVDENEPPVTSDAAVSLAESVAVGSAVASVAGADPEGGSLTYSIVGGDPDGHFTVDGLGAVTTADLLDFETTAGYTLQVDVTDGVNTVPVVVTVTVSDVNEPPVAVPVSLVVSEDAVNGTAVGAADVVDPEGDAMTFEIVSGDPTGQFAIGNDGSIVTSGPLDAETSDSYSLGISVSDGEFTVSTTAVVTVSDVDEPPETSPLSATLAEDVPVGTSVGSLLTSDPEGVRLDFTIVGGDPGGLFTVNPVGAIRTAGPLDFETASDHSLTVEVSDGVNTVFETVTVTVTDVDEAPVTSPVSTTLPEDAPIGSAVGTVTGIDPEGATVSFAITGGDPGGLFAIDTAGEVTTVGALNHETAASHSLTVEVSDGSNAAAETVTIIVSDVDEPPVTAPASATVSELATVGDAVVTLSASDPEGQPMSFTISAGDPGGSFTIGGSGVLKVAAPLDFETTSSYFLTVTVDDGVHVVDESVTINVTDVNEGPTSATSSMSVLEGGSSSLGSLLSLHTDPEGDSFSITAIVTDGTYGSASVVGGSSITYVHGGGESLTDTIVYEVQDSFGNPGTGTINVDVTPVNDPPAVDASADREAFVGVAYNQLIATSDADGSVSAVALSGLPDGLAYSFFSATGEILITGTPSLSTLDTTYPITITATDNLGANSAPMTFNIVVDPIGRSPYAGLVAFTEVLYAESEPYDFANPSEPTLMDEYLEITNLAGFTIDVENFKVTDTEDPSVATDFQFNSPPYLPQHSGRINQAFTQPTPLVAGQVVTAPIRRPAASSYVMQDGSTYPAEPWNLWFTGIDYGFPPGDNSNWEAFENSGDDIWLWDPDGLLVAFVAWDDGSADPHIASRPPEALGLWDTTHEGRLAGAADGHSISLAVGGDNTTSACWELTATADAASSGCGSVVATRDLDPQGTLPPLLLQSRISSQGFVN